jgi:methyl-accepting chemotaxis protein
MTAFVRDVCPQKSDPFTANLQEFIKYQTLESQKMVKEAVEGGQKTMLFALISIAGGFLFSIFLGYYFANSISKSLEANIKQLNDGAFEIDQKSNQIAEVSTKLSEAATQQAASLQETVASINEISAMIANNADSALSSAATSQKSQQAAQKGKEKAELMLKSINDISSGNDEIIQQMQNSNKEISEIVKVIEDISEKTKIINEIVFQTKLLSFNASVEAARAGEHGKGFAVVAEEVGNLASMSGNAATQITDMLNLSTKKVNEIVEGTKNLLENLIKQSKERVDFATTTAKDCATSLDEILLNVSSVNDMVKEISTASQEQSTGVNEVNITMTELDHLTQSNSGIALESS